jgi:hypothetical protein
LRQAYDYWQDQPEAFLLDRATDHSQLSTRETKSLSLSVFGFQVKMTQFPYLGVTSVSDIFDLIVKQALKPNYVPRSEPGNSLQIQEISEIF